MRWDGRSPLPGSELLQRGFGVLGFGSGMSCLSVSASGGVPAGLCCWGFMSQRCHGHGCPTERHQPPNVSGSSLIILCCLQQQGWTSSPASCLAPRFHLFFLPTLQNSPAWNSEKKGDNKAGGEIEVPGLMCCLANASRREGPAVVWFSFSNSIAVMQIPKTGPGRWYRA